jgi:hypothetical protein
LIKFAIFVPAFASINAKVAKLTAIVAKNSSTRYLAGDLTGDIAGDLVGDIVAKNLCYCRKTNLVGDITGELVGAKNLF